MNALTRFEPSTPVRYDVMNAMCTEVEARDTDLQEQINDLNELFSNSIRKNYPIGAGATQEITFERGIWLITIEATGLSASEFMYTGVLSFINQYAGNLTQLSRLDFGTSTNINITASANGLTILNGTTSDGIFQVRQVLLQGRIEDMVQAITESLNNAKAYTDTETAKRVLQTIYDAKMATLDTKNTEQDTAISEKVKVNGTATNVNFIEKKIVQDGLVKQFTDNTSVSTDETSSIISTSVIDVSFYFTAKDNSGTYTEHQIINFGDTTYISVKRTDMKTIRFITGETVTLESSILDKKIKMRYVNDGTNAKLFIDDKLIISSAFSYTYTSIILRRGRNLYSSCCAYNRILTTQEVNNNFSVLSSTKAIGAINDYTLAVDTDHTVDRSNRLQETINRTVYKQFCKEFTSDGADITVNNGMDGYVLSGEIKGQTVKNLGTRKGNINWEYGTATNFTVTNPLAHATEIGKQYTIIAKIDTNTLNKTISIVNFETSTSLGVGFVGIYKKLITASKSNTTMSLYAEQVTGKAVVDYFTLLEGDWTNKEIGYIPFGLSSTQAIVSNNGIQYPIYASESDKTNKTPISLGGVGGVYDTLTLNEDGSGVLVQNTKSLILNGSENWITSGAQPTDTTLIRFHIASDLAINSNYENVVLADKLNSNKVSTASTTEGISGNPSQSQLNIAILKAKLATQDSAGFKTWLQANPLTVRYQLATPITTYIDKSLMPTILTTKANTINLDSAVKASSLKVSLPCDRIAELQSQVTALQNAVLLLQS